MKASILSFNVLWLPELKLAPLTTVAYLPLQSALSSSPSVVFVGVCDLAGSGE